MEQDGSIPKPEELIINWEKDINIKIVWVFKQEQPPSNDTSQQPNDTSSYSNIEVLFTTEYKKELILHWGLFKQIKPNEWIHPPTATYPSHTKEFDKNALQTHFSKTETETETTYWIKCWFPTKETETDLKSIYGGMKFVFYNPLNNRWYNNSNMDYTIKFRITKPKKCSNGNISDDMNNIPEYVEDIINCEANYDQWTLSHRYNKCNGIWNSIDLSDNTNQQWILIWLRLSYQRWLDWQRNQNTPPRVLSGAWNNLTSTWSNIYIHQYKSEKPYHKLNDSHTFLIKSMISLLGKGNGNGQAIRDYILVIMHKFKLPRKGWYFYEQWHQKLHNNSTPDDIVICEALLSFLRSNNIEDYRRVLKEGGLTPEILSSYERNITTEPHHNYDYIHDFEIFCDILKGVHSNNDIVMMYNSAKRILGNCCQMFDEIINNKNDNNVMNQIERITRGRKALKIIISNTVNSNDCNSVRDIIFFDLALENYLRLWIEKVMHIPRNFNEYINEINLILDNIIVSFPNYIEWSIVHEDWFAIVVKNIGNINDKDKFLQVKSVYYRWIRCLNHITDYYTNYIQPKAVYFGKGCNIEKESIDIFSEELLRGTIFFALSMLLKKIEKFIREKSGMTNWLLISRGESTEIYGKIQYEKNEEMFSLKLMKRIRYELLNLLPERRKYPMVAMD